ncbi:MAG: hypothetical protein HS102_08030 [Planctomycetia bacterium]|nr:hypothetical protein [Planctomycetia bacterium]MBE7456563.1 hypothetical protein [Planctomycetia bacterium]
MNHEDEDEESDKKNKDERCRRCHHLIPEGADVIGVQDGVLGPRGFVPLESHRFFCDENCLRDYFQNGDVEKLSRRIP